MKGESPFINYSWHPSGHPAPAICLATCLLPSDFSVPAFCPQSPRSCLLFSVSQVLPSALDHPGPAFCPPPVACLPVLCSQSRCACCITGARHHKLAPAYINMLATHPAYVSTDGGTRAALGKAAVGGALLAAAVPLFPLVVGVLAYQALTGGWGVSQVEPSTTAGQLGSSGSNGGAAPSAPPPPLPDGATAPNGWASGGKGASVPSGGQQAPMLLLNESATVQHGHQRPSGGVWNGLAGREAGGEAGGEANKGSAHHDGLLKREEVGSLMGQAAAVVVVSAEAGAHVDAAVGRVVELHVDKPGTTAVATTVVDRPPSGVLMVCAST